jgi:uncharacterized membrane protein YbhN (UPF0104 family)
MRSLKRLLNPARHIQGGIHEVAALVVVTAVLALGGLIGLVWAAGFDAVGHRFAHADWWWLGAATFGEVVAYLGYVVAYREVATVEDGPTLTLPNAFSLVVTGFSPFIALGGFALDLEALRHAVDEEKEARVRVLGLGALEYAVLAPAACVAAIALIVEGKRTPSAAFTYPWAIAVPVGFAATFVAQRFRGRLAGKRGWRAAIGEGLGAVHVLHRLFDPPRQRLLAFAGAAAYWAGEIFCLWAALQCFGQRLGVAQLIIGYATGYALTRRTLPFAGAGVVEVLLSFALVWVGEPLSTAVLAVFAYRLINLWLPMIPALISRGALKRSEELQLAT